MVFAVSLLYVAAWFVNSQQARFLVPLLPAFAIVAALGAFTLAGTGAAGRYAVSCFAAAALAVGLAVSLVYTSQFVPHVLGRQSTAHFLAHKSSYYDGIAWLNRRAPNGVILTDIPGTLYLRPPYIVASADVLPNTMTQAEAVRLVRCWRVRYVTILGGDTSLSSLLRPALGRLVGQVQVRYVTSRTLDHVGPPNPMAVYSVSTGPRTPGSSKACSAEKRHTG